MSNGGIEMNETNSCDVFKDLYPSYINKELEDETMTFMKDHLEQCIECKDWIKSYKGEDQSEKEYEKKHIQKEDEIKVIKRARMLLFAGIAIVVSLSLWISFWIVS